MPVTDFIQGTEALLDFVVSRLETRSGWTVAKCPGSNARDVFKLVPELPLPCAIVTYGSSSYGNKPRRQASVGISVATAFDVASDKETARSLMDAAIALLDGQLSGMALFRAVSDRAVDLGEGVAAYEVQFRVEDH
jgi:hypothetical protein